MFGKSLDDLTVTELEELIRQRRDWSSPSGQAAIAQPKFTPAGRGRRRGGRKSS